MTAGTFPSPSGTLLPPLFLPAAPASRPVGKGCRKRRCPCTCLSALEPGCCPQGLGPVLWAFGAAYTLRAGGMGCLKKRNLCLASWVYPPHAPGPPHTCLLTLPSAKRDLPPLTQLLAASQHLLLLGSGVLRLCPHPSQPRFIWGGGAQPCLAQEEILSIRSID